MQNILKIFCLVLSVILILSFAGCKKGKNTNDSYFSDTPPVDRTPEYSISQTEDGQEIVVDRDGKAVEGANINEDGDIEIIDKNTGSIVKTIPKSEVKRYNEPISNEKTSFLESTVSDSSKNNDIASSSSSKTESGSKKDNPVSSSKPSSGPSSDTETSGGSSGTTAPSNPAQPSQPTTSIPLDIPNTSDNSVMTQAESDSVAEHFLELVNQERARVGVQSLTRKTELDSAAKTRVAETFVLLGHTRPDGRNFSSVLTDIKYGTPVENITSSDGINWVTNIIYDYGSSAENLARIGNSDKQECIGLAESFFTNLKNSKGHYQNMIGSDFGCTGIAVLEKFEDNMHIYNIIQIFTSK